jgi:hypothetical protein
MTILVAYCFCTLTGKPQLWLMRYQRNQINSDFFGRLVMLILRDQWGWFWLRHRSCGSLYRLICHLGLLYLYNLYRLFLTSHSFSVTIWTLGFRLFFYSAANKNHKLISKPKDPPTDGKDFRDFYNSAKNLSGTNKLGTGKFDIYWNYFFKSLHQTFALISWEYRGVEVVEYMYGGAQSETQDLTCPKCSEHIESEPSAQSFVLRPCPSVSCGETCEKML